VRGRRGISTLTDGFGMQIQCREKNQIYLMRARQDETKGGNVASLCILHYITYAEQFLHLRAGSLRMACVKP
jgi:hypothetical protein